MLVCTSRSVKKVTCERRGCRRTSSSSTLFCSVMYELPNFDNTEFSLSG